MIRVDHSNIGSDGQDLGELDNETDGTRKLLEDVVTQESLAELDLGQHVTTELVRFLVNFVTSKLQYFTYSMLT